MIVFVLNIGSFLKWESHKKGVFCFRARLISIILNKMVLKKKLIIFFLACFVFFNSSLLWSLASDSMFSERIPDKFELSPITREGGRDLKWHFSSDGEMPFFYSVLSKQDGVEKLELGLPTNIISSILLEDIQIIEDTRKQTIISRKGVVGGEVVFNIIPGEDSDIILEYINDGRAYRDIGRISGDIDPRALEDILKLLLNKEDVFVSVPSYELVDQGRVLKCSLLKNNRNVVFQVELPEQYVFKEKLEQDESSGLWLDLKKAKDRYSFLAIQLEHLLKDKEWCAERNIQKIGDKVYFKQHKFQICKLPFLKSDKAIALKIKFYDTNTMVPKAFVLGDVFEERILWFKRILEGLENQELRNLFVNTLAQGKMHIMDFVIAAGVPNYMTYFGRDTLLTYLSLFNQLTGKMKKHFLQQVLNKVNEAGECAHELDTRYSLLEDKSYDYRMTDSDYLLSFSVLKYFYSLKDQKKILRDFLLYKDTKNRFNLRTDMPEEYIDNLEVIVRNLDYVLNILRTQNLIAKKRKDDPSTANWRDALDSLGRGTYPFDINCVWVQNILGVLQKIQSDSSLKIFINRLLKKDYSKSLFYKVLNSEDMLNGLIGKWGKVLNRFKFEVELEEWRSRLKVYYDWYRKNADDKDRYLETIIGKNSEGKWISAREFIYKNKLPVTLPNGEIFPKKITAYAMCLDADRKLMPILHSDIGVFMTFPHEYSYKYKLVKKSNLREICMLPIALGGLAAYTSSGKMIGFVVANPMLANKSGYSLAEANIDSKDSDGKVCPPMVWECLDEASYHGMSAMWTWQTDYMVQGFLNSKIKLPVGLLETYYIKGDTPAEIICLDCKDKGFFLGGNRIRGLSVNPVQLWNIIFISTLDSLFSSIKKDDQIREFFINKKLRQSA
jgi:hypothetical protein